MDDDVIEVSDEGVFDVPATKIYRNDAVSLVEKSYKELTSGFSQEQSAAAVEREVLFDMQNLEYKVYRKNDGSKVFIVVKLGSDYKLQRLLVGVNYVEVITDKSEVVKVSLPELKFDFDNASATSWEDFVIIEVKPCD